MIDPRLIAESLEVDRSKRAVDRLVSVMAKEHFDLAVYLDLIRSSKSPMNWLLAWTLNHYYDAYPYLPERQQHLLWEFLQETRFDGIKRDVWRILSLVSLSESIAGEVFEKCVQIIPSAQFPVAVRAHAMQVGLNIVCSYPELAQEYNLLLEDLTDYEFASIRSRARRFLKRTKKLKAPH